MNKLIDCEKKGIRLIQIFENEWKTKKDIIQSKIRHILQENQTENIYARKCSIKEISNADKNVFLEEFHIQGKDSSSIKIGAYYDNELVSVMTFGKMRSCLGNKTSVDGEYELVRFATSKRVIGIAGKLLSYFIKVYKPQNITTFADRRYSDLEKNLYTQVGFKFVKVTNPNYWYFKLGYYDLFHRYTYRKQVLNKKLKYFDGELTEWENMKMNGWDRIWDCGNIKYEMLF